MADFLDQAFPENEAQDAEVVETPAPAPEPVAEAPEPEPVTPEVQTERPPEEPKPGYVPLAAMMDERDKRKAAEERAARLEQAQQEASQQRVIPDPYDDPDGFKKAVLQEAEQRRIADRFEDDAEDCKEKFGEDKLNAATQWATEKAQSDPSFAVSYMNQRKPITWIIKQHQQSADIADYSTDPVAFAKRILEQHGQQIAPAAVAPVAATLQPAPKTAMPPRSIASDSSPISAKEPAAPANFDAIFQR